MSEADEISSFGNFFFKILYLVTGKCTDVFLFFLNVVFHVRWTSIVV